MRLVAVAVLAFALAGCGGGDGGSVSRTETTPESIDPVQEMAAGEDVRERSVVIELDGHVTGTATLAPVGDGTRVTIRLADGATANGAAILRGGCDGDAVQTLELEGASFDGTIPTSLDSLLEDDATVGVRIGEAGSERACGESDAQMQ